MLSRLDPEFAHHLGMITIKTTSKLGLTRLLPELRTEVVEVMGLKFAGAFGLAAGFDKNAEAVKALGEIGFSHIEVGTVTYLPQPGNPKPRLFRLKKDRALINRMGFNNDGAEKIAERLAELRRTNSKLPVIGVNIGKSKIVELEDAVEDYRKSAKVLAPQADYLAVNVSSPNTPGLRILQETKSLEPILKDVIAEAPGKPVLVKIAPDLLDQDILSVCALAKKLGLAGVIATNTTVSRQSLLEPKEKVTQMGSGGLSGHPLAPRALEILKLIRKEIDKDLILISVGGVESKADVQERLAAGAD
ncbi:MAG: quinone-dependent dihydroorotate dehydrogenase, partial [Rhodoluna sp.]